MAVKGEGLGGLGDLETGRRGEWLRKEERNGEEGL